MSFIGMREAIGLLFPMFFLPLDVHSTADDSGLSNAAANLDASVGSANASSVEIGVSPRAQATATVHGLPIDSGQVILRGRCLLPPYVLSQDGEELGSVSVSNQTSQPSVILNLFATLKQKA